MATVTKWNPFGVALNVTATGSNVKRISATKFTVDIAASWVTYYSGNQTNYGMSATSGGVTETISAFGTKRSSGSGSFTGTYSISGNGAATKTITVTFKNYEEDWQGNVTESATKNVTFSVNVPAWTSYTVTYNANGGSGAPGSQTKWKDQTLTLSSTKPTRTGHTFQGWALTKADADAGTWYYQPGGSCGKNENLTLYAVWKANTYTVNFNANGGTGAPAKQTKTYGVTLKLSSTIPTKTNYNFLGWGTSASATTVAYKAGGSYVANAAITLYAIWELAYVKPRITNVSVTRYKIVNPSENAIDLWELGYITPTNGAASSGTVRAITKDYIPSDIEKITSSGSYQISVFAYDESGYVGRYDGTDWTKTSGTIWLSECILPAGYNYRVMFREINDKTITEERFSAAVASITFHGQSSREPSDDGTSVRIVFDWASDKDATGITIDLDGSDGSTKSLSPSASGTSGNVDVYSDGLDAEVTYTVKITVTDAIDYASIVVTLSGSKFVIDILAEGKGIAFNKSAELAGVADIGFQTRLTGGLLYVVLPPETDLDECHTPGFYVGENVSDYNYTNCPLTSGTFTLEILSMGDNGQLMQRLTQCHISSPIAYERVYYKSAGWGDWFGGWIYPTMGSEFEVYASDGVGSKPGCRKDGRVVEVRGIVKPVVDIAGSTDMHTIITVPVGYRPNSPVYTVCQGSGNCTWLLRVNTNGTVDFSRYRNGGTTTTATVGTWLPFQVTYLV